VIKSATLSMGELHLRLARWNQFRLAPRLPSSDDHLDDERAMRRLERTWLRDVQQSIAQQAASAPSDAAQFCRWFRGLETRGPGQNDPLFDWLAESADRDDMRWFLAQEAAGEAGFDDLLAMTLVKIPASGKLELARNFWDEMGRGNRSGMHGPLLERGLAELEIESRIDETVWPSLALANTMTALATNRDYALHSIGALGAIELTAPGRVARVAAGMARLGLSQTARKYFELHAILDVKHADSWIAEVFSPLIAENPAWARAFAEGALMRLQCGAWCFEAYRSLLWHGNALAAE
jgi:hypothetical protein